MRNLGGVESPAQIAERHSGRGIATQAASAIVRMARQQRRHRYMHAFPSITNAASNRVCERAGFLNRGECRFEYPKGRFMPCNDWRIDLFAEKAP